MLLLDVVLNHMFDVHVLNRTQNTAISRSFANDSLLLSVDEIERDSMENLWEVLFN